MAGKREKPEEIVSKLRQVEVLQGQSATMAEAVRQIGGEAFKPHWSEANAEPADVLSMAEALRRDAAVPTRASEGAGKREPAAETGGV